MPSHGTHYLIKSTTGGGLSEGTAVVKWWKCGVKDTFGGRNEVSQEQSRLRIPQDNPCLLIVTLFIQRLLKQQTKRLTKLCLVQTSPSKERLKEFQLMLPPSLMEISKWMLQTAERESTSRKVLSVLFDAKKYHARPSLARAVVLQQRY